jgi:hypothetical protein
LCPAKTPFVGGRSEGRDTNPGGAIGAPRGAFLSAEMKPDAPNLTNLPASSWPRLPRLLRILNAAQKEVLFDWLNTPSVTNKAAAERLRTDFGVATNELGVWCFWQRYCSPRLLEAGLAIKKAAVMKAVAAIEFPAPTASDWAEALKETQAMARRGLHWSWAALFGGREGQKNRGWVCRKGARARHKGNSAQNALGCPRTVCRVSSSSPPPRFVPQRASGGARQCQGFQPVNFKPAFWRLFGMNEIFSVCGVEEKALQSPIAPQWRPRIPFAQASQAALDKAAKLRAVLEPFLRGKALDIRSQAEREAAGVEAYRKEFGHNVGERWFRALLTRTIERDGGRQDWMNLCLYLDDNTGPGSAPSAPDRAAHAIHEVALGDTIRTLENPAKPSADDKKFLFDAAFRHLEANGPAAPDAAREFKRTLLDFLLAAVPHLAANRDALKVVFNYKWRAWTDAGGLADALQDHRPVKSGNFRKAQFTDDEKKIRDAAILHGGNIALGYRKERQAGHLSDAFVKHYTFDARRNKSYLPSAVREAITTEVEACAPIHRGPWQAKMRGPYIPRDWSDVAPGDFFSGDDVTWNSYFYFHDDDGRLHIEHGECLLLHDIRTGYLLDYALIAGKYNSRHIRKLILAVHDRHGLPHKGFYFERGVWKARLVTDIAAKDSLHWRETESGLDNFHLQVRHATTPRAKTIEGLIRILQERQRNEPGFVGFNERTLDMERMQDFLARARRGNADPAEKLLSMDQWKSRLDTIFAEFNADPQNGKMLRDKSPSEAWQAGLDKQPLRQLPETSRYLLATHCKQVRVRQEGIVLSIGKNRMLYCNDQTGPLIGRDVLAYYNLEAPELLTVSDLNRQNYFIVKAISLPALSASKEQFAAVHSQIAGHTRPAREIYGSIKHPRSFTVSRDTDASPATAALGEFHNAETARFKQEQSAENRTLRKIQLASPGRPVPANIRNPGRVLRGIEIENDWRAEQDAAELEAAEIPAPSSADDGSGEKVYHLDTAPGPAPSVALYWRLWARIKKATGQPENFRHALTQKHLGCHAMPQQQTPEQLAKMIKVFSAILRDARKAAAV